MEKKKRYAVMTGDITNFTKLSDKERENLIASTTSLILSWVNGQNKAAFFRGDSYQILIEDLDEVIFKSIQLICWFKKQGHQKQHQLSTRLSIGIGGVAYLGKSVLDSDGEAFHLSGRNFDEMSSGELISLATRNEKTNKSVQIILMFINLIIQKWTPGQSEAIYWYLDDQTASQESIALKLGIAQSGIAKRLRLAHWKEIEKAIQYLTLEIKESE